MQLQYGFKIISKRSLIGELIFVFIALLFIIIGFYLAPHGHRAFGIALGGFLFLIIWLAQSKFWLKQFKIGMKQMKAGDWALASNTFTHVHNLYTKYNWVDKYRYLLLITTNAYSFKVAALMNITFCMIRLKQQDKARFYYEHLLLMPDGKEHAIPFMGWFEKNEEE